MSLFKKQQKEQQLEEKLKAFHERYVALAKEFGADFTAKIVDCPTCAGLGKIPHMSLVEKK